MIGVVVPVHNEELHLRACLESIRRAASNPALGGEEVHIVVVLDACSDGSAEVALSFNVLTLEIAVRNVGRARANGASMIISLGARWLAFTDGDSLVPANWIVDQLTACSDAVCGTVVPDDWGLHSDTVRRRYELDYQCSDGHPHVHGANLGVSTEAYLLCGGFPPLLAHEDVAFVERLKCVGARIARLRDPCVVTSPRLAGRAPEGFACFLRSLAE